MYNKLFTKILDSSIWLEPDATRLVWLTMLAAMDEDGFVQFASVANLAHRARVTIEAAREAVSRLEAADEESSDPDNEGRRIERVPGGWMILNSRKYHDMVTRAEKMRLNRERVQRHRERSGNACEVHRNAPVMRCNDSVMQSEAEAQQASDTDTHVCKQRTPDAGGRSDPAPMPARSSGGAGMPAVPATDGTIDVRELRAMVLVAGKDSPIGERFRSRAIAAVGVLCDSGRDALALASDLIERSRDKPKAGAWMLRALEVEAGTYRPKAPARELDGPLAGGIRDMLASIDTRNP